MGLDHELVLGHVEPLRASGRASECVVVTVGESQEDCQLVKTKNFISIAKQP